MESGQTVEADSDKVSALALTTPSKLDEAPTTTADQSSPHSTWLVALVAACIAALGAVGGMAWLQSRAESSPSSPESAPRGLLAATDASHPGEGGADAGRALSPGDADRARGDVEVARYRLKVTITPPVATITLDGEEVSNPFKGHLPADEASHMIRATAPGYEPFERQARLQGDLELDVTLRPRWRQQRSTKQPRRPQVEEDPWHDVE